MIDSARVAGVYADAHAALEEAWLHSYDPQSALWAAMDHLENADREEAVMIAAVLASWMVTYLNPRADPRIALPEWLEATSELAARSWMPSDVAAVAREAGE